MVPSPPRLPYQPHQLKLKILFGTRIKALVLSTSLLLIFATACLNWVLYHRRHALAVFDDERRLGIAPFLISDESITLPLYNRELASQAIHTSDWTCGDKHPLTNNNNDHPRPFFAFVHVYKTAGSTLRDFFAQYANLCRKALMLIVSCSGVENNTGENNWNNCRLKAVMDARHHIGEHDGMKKEERIYPTINNTILHTHFDILAGHYRFGLTDNIFRQNQVHFSDTTIPSTPVRHIVFMRQPMERYVSSILYRMKQYSKEKKETVEEAANLIKKKIHDGRKNNEYWGSIFNYLLTPEESQTVAKGRMEYRTQLAIDNLVHYNAIVGITERFPESMNILQHVLFPDTFSSDERKDHVIKMFDKYTTASSSNGTSSQSPKKDVEEGGATEKSIDHNTSQMGSISTSSVMAELKKDDVFIGEFREYLKYDQMIVDFALKMHHMQHELVMEAKG